MNPSSVGLVLLLLGSGCVTARRSEARLTPAEQAVRLEEGGPERTTELAASCRPLHMLTGLSSEQQARRAAVRFGANVAQRMRTTRSSQRDGYTESVRETWAVQLWSCPP